MQAHFPSVTVEYLTANFMRRLDLPLLNGILLANSFHFVREREMFWTYCISYLRPGGCVLLVEYNANHGQSWVLLLCIPSLGKPRAAAGFSRTRLLATVPSRFLREIYAALSIRK